MRWGWYTPLLSALLALGCHTPQREFCLSDGDCLPGSRCVQEGDTRACRPVVAEGVGGAGGAGGEGGTGGVGGAGGSEVPTYAAEIELLLEPGPKLAEMLDGTVRRVGRVVIHPSAGGVSEIVVQPQAPLALPGRISVSLSMPGPRIPLHADVRVEAFRQDVTLAAFATGKVELQLEAEKHHEVRVELAPVADFDWDGDGDPDAIDCAPDDPNRHRRGLEICDGVPQSCAPHCILPLAEGETIRKVTCAGRMRICAAIVEEEDRAFIRIFPGDAPWLSTENRELENLVDIEWSEYDETLAAYAKPNMRFLRTDGSLHPGRTTETYGMHFAFAAGPYGVLVREGNFPFRLFHTKTYLDRVDYGLCSSIDQHRCVLTLFPYNVNWSTVDRALMTTSGDLVVLYGILRERSHIGFLVYDTNLDDRLFERIGPVPAFEGEVQPRLIGRSGDGILLVAGTTPEDTAAIWIAMADSYDAHPPPEPVALPEGVCIADLAGTGPDFVVRMADSCDGTLLELALDARGMPTGEVDRHPLLGCEKPRSLAVLPPKDDAPARVFVACEGEGHMVVRGMY